MNPPSTLFARLDGIAAVSDAIVFHNRTPGGLRLLVAAAGTVVGGGLLAVFLHLWRPFEAAPGSAWAARAAGVVFFGVLPLLLWLAALGWALLARSVELRLDARTRQATLSRAGLWGTRLARYPLGAVEIAEIELMAESPASEEPKVVLRMPDGTRVAMRCFADDAQAKVWAARLGSAIAGPVGMPRGAAPFAAG